MAEQLNTVAKKQWLYVLGNGQPDSARATECDDYSILLFHQGDLAVDQVAFFYVPIPAKLSESSSGKRITVTVVHDPETQGWGLESYFGIDLKWRMFRGDIDREQILEQMSGGEEAGDIQSRSRVGKCGSQSGTSSASNSFRRRLR